MSKEDRVFPKGKGRPLEILSEDQVKEVHNATLEVLEEVGIEVHEETLLGILKDVGAKVDLDSKRVRFSPDLVERLVKQAPSQLEWRARNSRYDLVLGDGTVNFGTIFGSGNILDLEGKRRSATFEDCLNCARLIDSLEYVDEGSCGFFPQDVPPEASYAYVLFANLTGGSKPFRGRLYGREQCQTTFRMLEVVFGSKEEIRRRPPVIANMNCVSPLTQHREQLEGMLEYATYGLPLIVSPEVQSGATGPVTMVGTVVQHNAEAIGAVAMVQAINPGNPVVYGQVSSSLDMHTGVFAYGAIEHGLLNVAMAQMARYYNLPSRGDAGTTDSKVLDMQAGYEAEMSILLAALSGFHYIFGAVGGGIEGTLVMSFEKLVIDNEIVGNVKRLLRGVDFDNLSESLELIKRVGPGRHYLGERHTLEHLEEEHFLPSLTDRNNFLAWQSEGSKTIQDRARERVRTILHEHEPDPLDDKVTEELWKIVKHVEAKVTGAR